MFRIFFSDCTAPFVIEIYTDATNDGTAAAANTEARGVCFEYTQVPCTGN